MRGGRISFTVVTQNIMDRRIVHADNKYEGMSDVGFPGGFVNFPISALAISKAPAHGCNAMQKYNTEVTSLRPPPVISAFFSTFSCLRINKYFCQD